MSAVVLFLRAVIGSGFLFLRLDFDVYRSVLLGGLFLIILFEPFLLLRAALSITFGVLILYQLASALLFSVITQSLVFNLNMKSLVRSNRLTTFMPFVALFIVLNTNYEYVLVSFMAGAQGMVGLIFQLVTNTILLVLLALIYIKTRFNNLPGMVFYLLYSASIFVKIVTNVDSFVVAFWNFIVLGVMFVIVELVMADNVYSRRILGKARRKSGNSRKRSGAFEYVPVIAVGSIIVFVLVGFPLIMGTAHPIYADPTGSMYPVIKPYSVLVVRGVSVQNIHNGSIIVFTAPWDKSITVAHQVIGIAHENSTLYFITKGIANPVKDPKPVPASDVHGIVIYAIPYLGYFFIYLYAILPLLIVPMIVKIR